MYYLIYEPVRVLNNEEEAEKYLDLINSPLHLMRKAPEVRMIKKDLHYMEVLNEGSAGNLFPHELAKSEGSVPLEPHPAGNLFLHKLAKSEGKYLSINKYEIIGDTFVQEVYLMKFQLSEEEYFARLFSVEMGSCSIISDKYYYPDNDDMHVFMDEEQLVLNLFILN